MKTRESLFCSKCVSKKDSRYCVKCQKNTKNDYRVEIADTLRILDSISGKIRRPYFKGFLVKFIHGYVSSRDKKKYPEGVRIDRVLDRGCDWYDEIVKDVATGKITENKHEPLSRHIPSDQKK